MTPAHPPFTTAALKLIRIVLSWSLIVEIEGRWPWQSQPGAHEVEQPAR